MMIGRAEAMKTVQEASFVLTELNEYLDTHPGCASGLSAYQQAKETSQKALDAYTAEYGPLRATDVRVGCTWQWVEPPWPWELEE